jgi:hypothetical protein
MTILDLVARATTMAIRDGVTTATPNSYKSNIKSVVKASCTIMNDKPVPTHLDHPLAKP